MQHVGGQSFEACADFELLKFIVIQEANDQNIDLYDNVFDWTLYMTRDNLSSDPYRYGNTRSKKRVRRDSDRSNLSASNIHNHNQALVLQYDKKNGK